MPNSRSCERENAVAVNGWPISCHSRKSKSRGAQAPPAHCPSSFSYDSRRAPQPSVSTLARSARYSASGASSRSRITCQRIDGSELRSQSITESDSTIPLELTIADGTYDLPRHGTQIDRFAVLSPLSPESISSRLPGGASRSPKLSAAASIASLRQAMRCVGPSNLLDRCRCQTASVSLSRKGAGGSGKLSGAGLRGRIPSHVTVDG